MFCFPVFFLFVIEKSIIIVVKRDEKSITIIVDIIVRLMLGLSHGSNVSV